MNKIVYLSFTCKLYLLRYGLRVGAGYYHQERETMRKNYRRKPSPSKTFPQISINDFETYVSITMDDMIQADRHQTKQNQNYGVKTFAEAGLRDEGYGVLVRCKDGSSFVISIKPLDESGMS